MFKKFVKDKSGMVEWIIAVLIGLAVLSVPAMNTATPYNRSADAAPFNSQK